MYIFDNAESMRDKDISDVTEGQLKAEQQALNDYLKEYGTKGSWKQKGIVCYTMPL